MYSSKGTDPVNKEQHWRCPWCDNTLYSSEQPKCKDHNIVMIQDSPGK